MVTRSTPLLTLVFLFASSLAAVSHSDNVDCVYSMFVKTAADPGAGTDSNVSMTLYDGNGTSVAFDNLVTWGGAMGSNHTYFQQDGLDIITGRAKCIDWPCKMILTWDETGESKSWKCQYVKVGMFSPDMGGSVTYFGVNKWLNLSDPSALVDLCGKRRVHKNTFGPDKAFSQIVSQIL